MRLFTLHNNTSEKEFTLMKGGVRLLHYITIHQKITDFDEGWCETLHYITIHQKRIDFDEEWCETLEVVTKGSGDDGKW